MKIEILLSTCKKESIKDLNLKRKNINNAISVNQFATCYQKEKQGNYTMYSYNEKGISKSRNRLIKHATGDIEVFTDDDITFIKNYDKIIEKAYKKYDADIIVFNLKKGNDIIGSNKCFAYNKISIMSVCSCQITFKRKSIVDNNIFLNEMFGIGSKFISGEENIFLKEALKKKLKIIHVPIVICEHPEEKTTGENLNDEVIISKGAFSYCCYKEIYILILFYFTVFKYKFYKNNYSIKKFIKLFNKGKKLYIKEVLHEKNSNISI